MAEDWKQIEHEVLGDFDPTFLLNAGAEAAKGIMTEVQKAEAAKKQSNTDNEKSAAAIAADRTATDACTEVALAQKGSPDTLAARQAVAQQALAAQAQAGMGLSSAAQAKRVEAANNDAKAAATALGKTPTDARAAAKAKCAAETASRVQLGSPSPTSTVTPAAPTASTPSFLKKMASRPAVWIGVGATALVVIGGVIYLVRRKKGK